MFFKYIFYKFKIKFRSKGPHSLESLNEQHRKQKKDLQSKVQSLKKTVTKGDRKKKKEIDAEIEKLEKDFEEKCTFELKQLEEKLKSGASSSPQLQSNESKTNETEPSTQIKSSPVPATASKSSKSKKRKEKKEKSNENREKQIELQEIENKKSPSHIELAKIKEKLKKLNLKLKEVLPDGNCMYYAVIDQLNQVGHDQQIKTFKELRKLTSEYMLANPNEFQAYLCSDETGDPLDEQQYEDYCRKINDTLVWGGQIELKAISDFLKVRIEVVQAEGSDIQIGDSNEIKLVITYHRFMFGSGEHYNSTCLQLNTDSNDEDN